MKKTLILALSLMNFWLAFAIGDVLTIIQRPILSVPQISVPGDVFSIECDAPEATQNWQASLVYHDITLPLQINSVQYSGSYARWFIEVTTPQPQIYELYDLQVSADGIETDIARNAVKLIPVLKDNYNFIHITDTHLPTTYYNYEQESFTDSTSMIDLRAVIRDINLINPEFVLLTGDLIHEGEIEEYQERRYFTKAKRLLGELDVPVYLVSGNHDVGGWDSTPPADGTARYNWWRFFGWERLSNPPQADFFTQNYSFTYGDIAFIGMESYINYDDYQWSLYGDTSFTSRQLQWLQSELAYYSNYTSKVMFYHFDFNDQINLSNLGVNMALWGHTHDNEGSIYTYPYNLGTRAVCNGSRSYRIISVDENDLLHPHSTNWAGSNVQALAETFSPSNDGSYETVTAHIDSNINIDFQEMRFKIMMPPSLYGYNVTNGEVVQIERTPEHNICYVSFDLAARGSKTITVTTDYSIANDESATSPQATLKVYPNPFHDKVNLKICVKNRSMVKVQIYNIKGQVLKTLIDGEIPKGQHDLIWDGTTMNNEVCPNGVYFYKVLTDNYQQTRKMLLLK